MANIETRVFNTLQAQETRQKEGDTPQRHIIGVIPYNSPSERMESWNGDYQEKINANAFKRSLKEQDQRALWAHNTQYVLGRASNGTLTFDNRADGLHFDILLPDTTYALDCYNSIKRGDTPGVSFGFIVQKQSWQKGKNGNPDTRELLDVDLLEVSPGVAFPAYPASNAEGRDNNAPKIVPVYDFDKPTFDARQRQLDLLGAARPCV